MHKSTRTDKVKGLKGPISHHVNRHHVCHGVNNIFASAFFYSYQDDFTLRQVGVYMTESYGLNTVKRIIWVIKRKIISTVVNYKQTKTNNILSF